MDRMMPFDDTPATRTPPSASGGDDRSSSSGLLGGNVVGVLTAVSFVAFLVVFIVWGQRAAAITFWAAMAGLPIVVFVLSTLGAAWRRGRRNELIEIAVLAVEMSDRRTQVSRKVSGRLSDVDIASRYQPHPGTSRDD